MWRIKRRHCKDSQNAALCLWYLCFLLALGRSVGCRWSCLMNCMFGWCSIWCHDTERFLTRAPCYMEHKSNVHVLYGAQEAQVFNSAMVFPACLMPCLHLDVRPIMRRLPRIQQSCFGTTVSDKMSKLRSATHHKPLGAESQIQCFIMWRYRFEEINKTLHNYRMWFCYFGPTNTPVTATSPQICLILRRILTPYPPAKSKNIQMCPRVCGKCLFNWVLKNHIHISATYLTQISSLCPCICTVTVVPH